MSARAPNTSSVLADANTGKDYPQRAAVDEPRPEGGGRGTTAPARPAGCVHGCSAPARLYPCGDRCDQHAPRPIPPVPDPARTLDGLRAARGLATNVVPTQSAGWKAIDARAVGSGKRRANAGDVAAARAELAAQKLGRSS